MNLRHIAFIMDGNGRWAEERGLDRSMGHRQGLTAAERVIDHSMEIGLECVSLYVFSTENWKRPQKEIDSLFSLAAKYLDGFERKYCDRARIVVSGRKDRLPARLGKKIVEIEQKTKKNSAFCVNLCIDYGGQTEIVDACEFLASQGKTITVQAISESLYNAFLPPPDLIVRTGGMQRLSNFLLFNSAYAELYFCNTLWPDFSVEEYDAIVASVSGRVRSFGGIEHA